MHQPTTQMSRAAVLVDKDGNLFGNRIFRLRMEEDREDGRREQSEPEWDEEKQRVIDTTLSILRFRECRFQAFPEETPDERSQSKDISRLNWALR